MSPASSSRPTPPSDLKARVLAAAAREPSAGRRAVRRRALGSWAWALALTFAIFLALGGFRAVERPVSFVLGTAAVWAVIALAASLGSSRGQSMLGRPRVVLLTAMLVTPATLLAARLAWPDVVAPSVAPNVIGAPVRALVCLGVSLSLAIGPFVALVLGRRGVDPVHPRLAAATIGVVAGAWASVLIDLHCELTDVLHVAVGHVLPVALLAVLGALVGERLLGVRRDTAAR
jgi:hypothetical protein